MSTKTIRKSSLTILFTILSGILLQSNAQNQYTPLPFSLEHFNSSTGLPQNTVQGIVQDSKGNIWIGTFGGLVRYNGSQSELFEPSNDSVTSANRILYLTINKQDELFAASANGRILHVVNDTFKVYRLPKGYGKCIGLEIDSEGSLMLISRKGVLKLANNKFIPHPDYPPFQIPAFSVNSYYNPVNKNIYVLSGEGVFKIDSLGVTSHPFYRKKYVNGMKIVGDTSYFHSHTHTDIWVKDSIALKIPNSGRKTDRSAFSLSQDNTMWEAHDGGIRRINPDLTYEDFGGDYLLPTLKYRSVFIDNEENLWIGSDDNGIIRIRPDLFNVYIDNDNPASFNLQGIYPDTHGIWLALDCAGVGFYSFKTKSIETYGEQSQDNWHIYNNGCISSFEMGYDSSLWIGTYGEGLLNYRNGKYFYYDLKDSSNKSSVLVLLNKNADSLILGIGAGVLHFDVHTKLYKRAYPNSGLDEQRIQQIYIDTKKRTWFGTYDGVYMDDGKNLHHYTLKNGLPNLSCRSFYEDEYGDIWVGTYGSGLARYNNTKFETIGVTDGLWNGVVSSFVRDGDRLWMTSNNGIYAASFTEMRQFLNGEISRIHCISFGTESGLNTNEFNGKYHKPGFKHTNGKLYFPSMNGLVELDPTQLPNIPTPEIHLNAMFVDGGKIDYSSQAKFNTDIKRITFQISIPAFAFPENILAEYRLVGYDSTWFEFHNKNELTFTNLPAGSYQLQLRTQSLLSQSREYKSSSYPFIVTGPWYSDIKIFAFISLAGIGLSLFSIILVQAEAKKRKEKFKTALEERTKELLDSEQRLTTLIENTDMLIWSIDDHYKLQSYNWQFAQWVQNYFGFKAELGLDLVQATKPATRKFWFEHYQKAINGKEVKVEVTHVTSTGTKTVMETNLFPIKDDNNITTGAVGFCRDMTEIVNREQELRNARKAAEQAAKAKSDFLATMSHEIRTPLNGVVGTTSLLLSEKLDERQKDLVKTIRLSSETLMKIINEILDFSKLESENNSLETVPFHLKHSIEETVSLIRNKAVEKGLIIHVTNDKRLPEIVKGDVTRLRQILLNLLHNAVKFTSKGEVRLAAEVVEVRDEKGIFKFSVSDTGIGIGQEKLGELFKPFNQLDQSTTRKFGGTGLGLSISKKLVELMNGEIWAESVPNQGTTFYFTAEFELVKTISYVNDALPEKPDGLTKVGIVSASFDQIEKEIEKDLIRWGCSVARIVSSENILELKDHDFLILCQPNEKIEQLTIPHFVVEAVQHEIQMSSSSILGKVKTQFVEAKKTNSNIKLAHILVAEDNLVNQKIATMLLERLGHRADIVANGLEAIESLTRQNYDLVLMDVQMPELDGLEATLKIRSEFPADEQPIIIAVTANAMDGDREKCLEAGMNDYLAKPVTLQSLEKVLSKWLS